MRVMVIVKATEDGEKAFRAAKVTDGPFAENVRACRRLLGLGGQGPAEGLPLRAQRWPDPPSRRRRPKRRWRRCTPMGRRWPRLAS